MPETTTTRRNGCKQQQGVNAILKKAEVNGSWAVLNSERGNAEFTSDQVILLVLNKGASPVIYSRLASHHYLSSARALCCCSADSGWGSKSASSTLNFNGSQVRTLASSQGSACLPRFSLFRSLSFFLPFTFLLPGCFFLFPIVPFYPETSEVYI